MIFFGMLAQVNTAVSAACLGPNVCSIEWPGPTGKFILYRSETFSNNLDLILSGLAASFNRSMWHMKGDILSTEMRAFNNLNGLFFCFVPLSSIF